MRVNEIFVSLQGEGYHAGTAAVFLRFSGCNLKCPFCDTQHQSFTEMTEDEIVKAVSAYVPRTLIVTGGEPMLQLTPSLVTKLHKAGFSLHVETNGTIDFDTNMVDWVTCSPKVTEGGRLRLSRADEVKLLYRGSDTDFRCIEHFPADNYYLQPLDTGDAARNQQIIQETINYIIKNPKWKLSLQTHKILNIR